MPEFDPVYHRIYLKFPHNNFVMQIPVPPEIIAGRDEILIRKHSLVSFGEVASVGGPKLRTYAWESHFPYAHDPSICVEPEEQHRIPLFWRDNIRRTQLRGNRARLTITGAMVDLDTVVGAFDWSFVPGAPGDIWYQIHLDEWREGVIREFNGIEFPEADVRPNLFSELPASYKSRPGQTLMDIAQIIYGDSSMWVDLFEANHHTLLGAYLVQGPGVIREPGLLPGSPEELARYYELWDPSQPVKEFTELVVPKVSIETE